MSTKVHSKVRMNMTHPSSNMHIDGGGFDVTATIGSVRFGEGEMSPVEAALQIIGRHGAEGEYRFPHEDGGHWVVRMNHEEDKPADGGVDDYR